MQLISIRQSSDRLVLVSGFFLTALALVLLRVFDPLTSGVFPPCPLHALTGLYCPGCGSLRAMHALLHGNLRVAFAMNPLAMLALPFLVYGVVSWVLLQVSGRQLPRAVLSGRWIWALGALVALYGIARNIPVYPFSLLAPGGMSRL